MEERYLPRFRETNEMEVEVNVPINNMANHVHAEFNKINLDDLNHFLRTGLGHLENEMPTNNEFGEFIEKSVTEIIASSYKPNETDRAELMEGLRQIMLHRLSGLLYEIFTPALKECIFLSLEYAKRQPIEFKTMYVSSFIHDTLKAYCELGREATIDDMSCAAGALERLILAMLPSSHTGIDFFKKKITEYIRIDTIMTKNKDTQIPLLISEWFYLHKAGANFSSELNDPDNIPTQSSKRRQNLKDYLLADFPNDEVFIEAQITEFADSIGYENDQFPPLPPPFPPPPPLVDGWGGKSVRRNSRKSSRKKGTTRKKRILKKGLTINPKKKKTRTRIEQKESKTQKTNYKR